MYCIELAEQVPTLLIDLVKLVAIVLGVWFAFSGINAWRREHIGRRRIELAEDTLAMFYEAVDVIRYIRNPMSFGYETEDVERRKNESDVQFEARKNASVVFYRYNQHQELFSKIHALRYRFMAQIGKNKAGPFDELRKITSEVTTAARALARLWPRDYFGSDEQWKKHQARIEKHEAVFWEEDEENDLINPRLEKVVVDIEKTCQLIIMGKDA